MNKLKTSLCALVLATIPFSCSVLKSKKSISHFENNISKFQDSNLMSDSTSFVLIE